MTDKYRKRRITEALDNAVNGATHEGELGKVSLLTVRLTRAELADLTDQARMREMPPGWLASEYLAERIQEEVHE